jgi:hypothetical protein
MNLWVKEAYVGRGFSHKKMDIKARGKTGLIRVPKSRITIILEEKPEKELIKMILMGQTPLGLAQTMRQVLYQQDADFEDLQRVSHLTTAKGRTYRKTQFDRLVDMVIGDLKERGHYMKRERVIKNLLDREVQTFMDKKNNNEQTQLTETRSDRRDHFEKNFSKK